LEKKTPNLFFFFHIHCRILEVIGGLHLRLFILFIEPSIYHDGSLIHCFRYYLGLEILLESDWGYLQTKLP